MKTIQLGELELGDVLISFMGKPNQTPDVKEQALWARHASIVSGKSSGGAVFHVHNTNTGIRGENRKFDVRTGKWSGTIRTDVVPPKGAPTREEESGSQLRVFRCSTPELGKRAAAYANRWDGYEIPYSESKLSKAKSHEAMLGSNEQVVASHRELFRQHAKFRAIKYAARRNGFLCYPDGLDSDPGMKHGMFCSQLVAVCYQVAGLEKFVEATPPANFSFKVTDKKMSPKDLGRFKKTFKGSDGAFTGYQNYTRHLHSVDPYQLAKKGDEAAVLKDYKFAKKKGFTYLPSIAFWKENSPDIQAMDWAANITEGMMLDNKTIMPTGLFACLMADKKGWTDMGFLVGKREFSESPAEKQKRLRAKSQLTDRARSNYRFNR